ncbi:hypothetical protein D3C76_953110 [compost metagenome]
MVRYPNFLESIGTVVTVNGSNRCFEVSCVSSFSFNQCVGSGCTSIKFLLHLQSRKCKVLGSQVVECRSQISCFCIRFGIFEFLRHLCRNCCGECLTYVEHFFETFTVSLVCISVISSYILIEYFLHEIFMYLQRLFGCCFWQLAFGSCAQECGELIHKTVDVCLCLFDSSLVAHFGCFHQIICVFVMSTEDAFEFFGTCLPV